MPYTSYANLTIGTIDTVKKKLSSPSLALQLTETADTIYSILSVSTLTSQITTQSNHNLSANSQVQFIGTSLPAPLAQGVTYFAIVVSSVIFQVSATSGGGAITLTTAGSGLMSVRSLSALDQAIQTALDDTKANTLANHIDTWARDVMPSTIPRWIELRTAHFQRWHRRFNLDTFPVMGMFRGGSSSGWFFEGGQYVGVNTSVTGLSGRQHPETFWITLALGATPVNGSTNACTLWGSARNGDRAIDVNNNVLYINRGDDTANPVTVDWQVQNYYDLKDYLINPQILAQPHSFLAISRLFTLGAFRQRAGFSQPELKAFMLDGEDFWHRKFIGSLYGEFTEYGKLMTPGVLKLLQTDFSNLGQWGEFDKEMAGEEHWGAV